MLPLIDRQKGALLRQAFQESPMPIRIFFIAFGLFFVGFLIFWIVSAVSIGLSILRG